MKGCEHFCCCCKRILRTFHYPFLGPSECMNAWWLNEWASEWKYEWVCVNVNTLVYVCECVHGQGPSQNFLCTNQLPVWQPPLPAHLLPPLSLPSLLLAAPLGLIINWKICLFCKFAREQNQSVCMEFPNSCAYFSSLISCFVFLSVSPFMASPYVATRAGGQAQRPCVHVETKWEKGEGKRNGTRHKGYAC